MPSSNRNGGARPFKVPDILPRSTRRAAVECYFVELLSRPLLCLIRNKTLISPSRGICYKLRVLKIIHKNPSGDISEGFGAWLPKWWVSFFPFYCLQNISMCAYSLFMRARDGSFLFTTLALATQSWCIYMTFELKNSCLILFYLAWPFSIPFLSRLIVSSRARGHRFDVKEQH